MAATDDDLDAAEAREPQLRVLRALRRSRCASCMAGEPFGAAAEAGKVIVSDINPLMLAEGEKRAAVRLNRPTDVPGNPLPLWSSWRGTRTSSVRRRVRGRVYHGFAQKRHKHASGAEGREAASKPGGRHVPEFSRRGATSEPIRGVFVQRIPALARRWLETERHISTWLSPFASFRQEELARRTDAGFKSVTHEIHRGSGGDSQWVQAVGRRKMRLQTNPHAAATPFTSTSPSSTSIDQIRGETVAQR